LDRAATDDTVAVHLPVDLARPIDLEVGLIDACDLGLQVVVSEGSIGRRTLAGRVIGAGAIGRTLQIG